MSLKSQRHDAFELLVPSGAPCPVLLTVEHASNRLPEPWTWPDADAWIKAQHWAFDPGAEDLARDLSAALHAVCVVSRFSRLLIDPNRPVDADTLFRDRADGRDILLNGAIDAPERARRIQGWYRPYHDAIERAAKAVRPRLVLGVHSFTPVYEGQRREVEIGVLHVDQQPLADAWVDHMRGRGYQVERDQPYAGAEGFMFGPVSHAQAAGCPALELEIRQDRCTDPNHRAEIAQMIVSALRETGF